MLSRSQGSLEVTLLLQSLQATLEFEREFFAEHVAAVAPGDAMQRLLQTSPWLAADSLLISRAFEPHLGLFVDAQDRCGFSVPVSPSQRAIGRDRRISQGVDILYDGRGRTYGRPAIVHRALLLSADLSLSSCAGNERIFQCSAKYAFRVVLLAGSS